jgi:hypothetical protein
MSNLFELYPDLYLAVAEGSAFGPDAWPGKGGADRPAKPQTRTFCRSDSRHHKMCGELPTAVLVLPSSSREGLIGTGVLVIQQREEDDLLRFPVISLPAKTAGTAILPPAE